MAVERVSGGSSLIDVLDRVLDKGIVIDAWVRISLVGIDLITVEARVVVASIDTYLKYADAVGLTGLVSRPQLGAGRRRRNHHCRNHPAPGTHAACCGPYLGTLMPRRVLQWLPPRCACVPISRTQPARVGVRHFACSALSAATRSFPSCWRRSSPWGIPAPSSPRSTSRPRRSLPDRLAELLQDSAAAISHVAVLRMENPLVRVLHSQEPELVPGSGKRDRRSLLLSSDLSQQAPPAGKPNAPGTASCIAVENFHSRLKLQLQEQVCGICDMRAYAAMVVVEIARGATQRRYR